MQNKPTNFMPMEQWIQERDNYDEIKRLTFFTKFRKWKTLKMWVTNVTRHKTNICKKLLEQKLFLLHPILVRFFNVNGRENLYYNKDKMPKKWKN